MGTSPTGARVAALDAVRGAAVLAVVAYHCFLEFNRGDGGALTELATWRYSAFVPRQLGALGVQLFFVLSGFCIHRSMLRWHQAHPGAPARTRWWWYARRRAWRIMPLYLLVLLGLFVITHPAPWSAAGARELLVHASLLHTLVPDHINHINPSFWSLAVEVQLYALYPLLWLGTRRLGPHAALLLAAGLALAWRFEAAELSRSTWVVRQPLTWGFEWFAGVWVAETLAWRWPSGRIVLGVAAAALVVVVPSRDPHVLAVVPPLVFVLVVGWAARRPSLPTAVRPLAWLGSISYALYLVHQPLLDMVADAAVARGVHTVELGPFLLLSGATVAACVAIAAVLEPLAERVLRWATSRATPAPA